MSPSWLDLRLALVLCAGGCKGDASPPAEVPAGDKAGAEEQRHAEGQGQGQGQEPAKEEGPTLSPACQTVVDEVCGVARAPCSEIRGELLRIGLPEPMCKEAAQHIGVLHEVTPGMGGVAAAKLLTLTSEHAGYSPDQRKQFDGFRQRLADQWVYVASDGSDSHLPSATGLSFYMGPRLGLHVRQGEARLGTDPEWVLQSEGGKWPADAYDGDKLTTLVSALRTHAQKLGTPPGAQPEGRMELHADAGLRWRTLAPLLRSAHEAGHVDVAIVSRKGGKLRESFVSLRDRRDPFYKEDPGPVPVEILPGGFRIVGEAAPTLAALGEKAKRSRVLFPANAAAALRVGEETTVQQLLDTVEALAGCQLDEAIKGADIPESCMLWVIAIDPDR